MQSRLGTVGAAAVLAAVAVAAAGCSSGGSSSSGARVSPAQQLAATVKNAQSINSFTAEMSVRGNGISGAGMMGAGNVALNGTFSEQRQPTEIARFDVGSLQASGANLGPMSTITTPSALYLKMPMISALTHSTKPYLKIPASALKSGGLSSLIGQAQSSNPLSAAQLLAGATNTRTVGTGTVNGVAVTELEGSEPVSAALAKLPANVRSSFGQDIQKLGVGQIKFQAWVDGQHNFRKLIVNEIGRTLNETVTVTVTSINQPVHISVPPAAQVSTLPASALRGSAGL